MDRVPTIGVGVDNDQCARSRFVIEVRSGLRVDVERES